MSTTDTTATQDRPPRSPAAGAPAHTSANCVHRDTRPTTANGLRLKFTCPSSRPDHPDHILWTGSGGEAPCCTCQGYATHGHCTLTRNVEALLLRHYAARCAALGDSDLIRADRDLTGEAYRGTLTTGDWLAYDAVGDEIAERFISAGARRGRRCPSS